MRFQEWIALVNLGCSVSHEHPHGCIVLTQADRTIQLDDYNAALLNPCLARRGGDLQQ